MEYGKAFTFITEDENWIAKMAIVALLVLASGVIPILPTLPLLGYTLELTRNVARGEPRPLPHWENLEEKSKQGAMEFVVTFLYRLPIVLVGCCFFGLAVWTTVGASGSGNGGAALPDALVAALPWLIVAFVCLSLLYGISIGLLSDAATAVLASKGNLRDALKLRDVLALTQRYLGDFVMLMLVTLVGGFVTVLLTIVTCGIGAIVAGPWLMLAQAHLLGQIARKAFPPMADALVPVASPVG